MNSKHIYSLLLNWTYRENHSHTDVWKTSTSINQKMMSRDASAYIVIVNNGRKLQPDGSSV